MDLSPNHTIQGGGTTLTFLGSRTSLWLKGEFLTNPLLNTPLDFISRFTIKAVHPSQHHHTKPLPLLHSLLWKTLLKLSSSLQANPSMTWRMLPWWTLKLLPRWKPRSGKMLVTWERERKGKLPSQRVPNPKLQFHEGSSSNAVHGLEHVQAVVTLRSGKQVDKWFT
jgi:hypothetical protein